jgi:SAM-dependent methyltransferase
LLANHFNVTVVDVSPEMVSRARTAVPEANFLAADIRDVRFERGSFDAVIALYSLIHVPRGDHQELLSRVHAWLVDDGVLVANFGARDLPEGRDPDWLGSGEMTWSFFDAATNLRLLDETGFEIDAAHVISPVEPGGADVEFLWTVARKRPPAADPAVARVPARS